MNAADQERVQAVLTATAPCETLPDWFSCALEAVDELLGFRHSRRPRRETLVALAPGLARQLRSFLPRGLPGAVSARERQTAELVALGFGNREIAATFNVGTETVKKHVYRAITRLGLERRTQLAVSWATGKKLVLPAVQRPEHRENV